MDVPRGNQEWDLRQIIITRIVFLLWLCKPLHYTDYELKREQSVSVIYVQDVIYVRPQFPVRGSRGSLASAPNDACKLWKRRHLCEQCHL
jgi:hypothetical protein